jgi:DNA polymerase-3 subunit delta'
MQFKDIIGQSAIVSRLRTSIDRGTLPHAVMLNGIEGTGGLAIAVATAQYLQCEDRHDGAPCGQCQSCRQYAKLVHPDLHFVYPTVNRGTSTSPSTSEDYLPEWREAFLANPYLTLSDWLQAIGADNKQGLINQADSATVIRHLTVKPYQSDYRVMIIWMPEKMNETAANKLLKLIEEPYERTHFFLVSCDANSVLGTIQSRTQRIQLPPLDEETIARTLTERQVCPPDVAQNIAHIAHGSWSRALSLISEGDERREMFDKFCAMMRLSYARKLYDMKEWSEDMAALGRERQKNYLQYAQQLIRENFILNYHQPQLNYLSADEAAFAARFSPFVNHSNVEGIMQELATAETDIAGNVSAKMVFFDLSLKLIMLLKKGGENIPKS